MATGIHRFQRSIKGIALTTSAATTPAITFDDWAGGIIRIPSGSSITLLTFYASVDSPTFDTNATINFDALNTTAGVAVTLTVAAAKAYPFPADCFGAGGLKITADVAGSIDISLKG